MLVSPLCQSQRLGDKSWESWAVPSPSHPMSSKDPGPSAVLECTLFSQGCLGGSGNQLVPSCPPREADLALLPLTSAAFLAHQFLCWLRRQQMAKPTLMKIN